MRYPVGSLARVIDGKPPENPNCFKTLSVFFFFEKKKIENNISNIVLLNNQKNKKTKTGPQIQNTSPLTANPWAPGIGREVDEGGG